MSAQDDWSPLVVSGLTIGLVCPECGQVVPPSDEGDPQAAHTVKCTAESD